jgi:hypothetical protein
MKLEKLYEKQLEAGIYQAATNSYRQAEISSCFRNEGLWREAFIAGINFQRDMQYDIVNALASEVDRLNKKLNSIVLSKAVQKI